MVSGCRWRYRRLPWRSNREEEDFFPTHSLISLFAEGENTCPNLRFAMFGTGFWVHFQLAA
jgi:hypothetical protein